MQTVSTEKFLLRILYIDDEEKERYSIESFFALIDGVQILTCDSPDAIKAHANRNIDIFIADLYFHGSYEHAKIVREVGKLRALLPLITFSAHPEGENLGGLPVKKLDFETDPVVLLQAILSLVQDKCDTGFGGPKAWEVTKMLQDAMNLDWDKNEWQRPQHFTPSKETTLPKAAEPSALPVSVAQLSDSAKPIEPIVPPAPQAPQHAILCARMHTATIILAVFIIGGIGTTHCLMVPSPLRGMILVSLILLLVEAGVVLWKHRWTR